MALNSIAYASKYAAELDKMIVQKAVTGFFADNIMKAQFVGAHTVLIPDIDFVGLGDYDRDSGFPQGKTAITNTSYTLSKDRGRELQIDRMDMDESGIANLAGQVLQEYVRTEVVPEMDAYNLSKLAGVATTKSHTVTYAASTVLTQLITLINNIQAQTGFTEELVAFLDPSAYAALMTASEISKQIIVSDFKQGDINLKVKKLNDVALIPVAADRMKTAYTFNAGATATTGGFSAASNAQTIHMLVMPKNGASLVKKTEKLRIFTPDQNQDADAYLFQYRLYYDIFVKKSGLDHIYAALSAASSN